MHHFTTSLGTEVPKCHPYPSTPHKQSIFETQKNDDIEVSKCRHTQMLYLGSYIYQKTNKRGNIKNVMPDKPPEDNKNIIVNVMV